MLPRLLQAAGLLAIPKFTSTWTMGSLMPALTADNYINWTQTLNTNLLPSTMWATGHVALIDMYPFAHTFRI